jgi:MoaA/NifB/PqqE/SkfB family radical SAM enzyme
MKENGYPKRVTVEMTNRCNLRCLMCPRYFMTDPEGDMDAELWQKIMDDVAGHNVILLPFWRGESTLHPRFMSMITYARARVKEIHIATNGITASRMGGSFIKTDFVNISCHDPRSLVFLEEMWQSKKNWRRKKPMLQASVVEGERYDEDIYELAEPYADVIRVYRKHSVDGEFGAVSSKSGKRVFCDRLLNEIVIDYQGNVSRCCYNWDRDAPMNVRDNSIEKVWNSPEYKQIRNDYPDEVCAKCDQWSGATLGSTKIIERESI